VAAAGLLAMPLPAPPNLVVAKDGTAPVCPLTSVTYPVVDLVVPFPNVLQCPAVQAQQAPATATQERRLIKYITNKIEPKSWSDKGGRGTVDYHLLTMSLVICQTPDIQEQIADLLASLRRLQNQQVVLEVRFLFVDESFMDRLSAPQDAQGTAQIKGMTEPPGSPAYGPQKVWFLSDAQMAILMDGVQDDRHANLMQLPKMTMFNCQSSDLEVADAHEFVTGLDVRVGEDGDVLFRPQAERVPVGLRMTVKPVVSADRRFVNMRMKVDLSSLDDPEADLIPIRLPPMPPSPDAVPERATQMLQRPRISRLTMDQAFIVPDGKTALISGWTRERQVRTESGPPVLSDIPYLNRLFKTVGSSPRRECVLLTVTPRIVVPEEDDEKVTVCREQAPADAVEPCAAPPCSKHQQAAELVAKYNQACPDGRTAEAVQLAVQALALDPACFQGNGQPPAVLQTSSPQR
jgi:type II secretory pathway component GspD/PulD (secretin)